MCKPSLVKGFGKFLLQWPTTGQNIVVIFNLEMSVLILTGAFTKQFFIVFHPFQ